MTKTMTKLCFLSLMTLGFAACTEDPVENNGTTTPADMGTTPTDQGTTPTDQGTTPTDQGTTPTDMGTTPADQGTTPVDMPVAVEAGCTGANPPARCTADPKTFADWAPASVISRLTMTTAEDCCYDYTGDGETNNALGNTIKQLGATAGFSLEDINASLSTAIGDGSVALVLEHEGVMPAAGGPFAINFMLGEPQGFTGPVAGVGNEYKIDPISFEAGVWPQARINDATLTGSSVTTGQGTVAIAISLFGVSLTLRISAAQIEATVVSADANGVALSNGKLGGVLRVDDLIGALNSFAEVNCGCLDLKGKDLLAGSFSEGYECSPIVDTCDKEDSIQNTCSQVAGQCNLIKIIPTLADVNSTNIGSSCESQVDCDAISVGFTFDAAGAVITGVAEPAQ